MSQITVTTQRGTFNSGGQIKQFKALNNQPYAMFVNLGTEIPTAERYQYQVAGRGNLTSPEITANSLSWYLTGLSNDYPYPQITTYDHVVDSPALLVRELQAQELVSGYPFVSSIPGSNSADYDLPEIPIFNHMPVMLLISNRNPITSIGYVLRNRVPFYGGVTGPIDYLYGCGSRGVFTYIPAEETTILSPQLFVVTGAVGDIKETTVYAYYTRTPYTAYPPQSLMLIETGTEGGANVSNVQSQTLFYGLSAGQYRLTVFVRPTTLGATETLRGIFTYEGTNTVDLFEQPFTAVDTGEASVLQWSSTLVSYRFLEVILTVPRACFGKLVLSTTSASVYRCYPTVSRIGD